MSHDKIDRKKNTEQIRQYFNFCLDDTPYTGIFGVANFRNVANDLMSVQQIKLKEICQQQYSKLIQSGSIISLGIVYHESIIDCINVKNDGIIDKTKWTIGMSGSSAMFISQNTTGTNGQWSFPIILSSYNHVVVNFNSVTLDTPTVYVNNVAPLSIYPFDDDVIADIIMGKLMIMIKFNFSEIVRKIALDGWEVIGKLKKDYESRGKASGIPVIVLSSTSGDKSAGLVRKKSIHEGKAGYSPLVSVAKEACIDNSRYDATGEQGLLAWLKYFVDK